jgi:triphosphoribosyl-dephospho-CoA synthase
MPGAWRSARGALDTAAECTLAGLPPVDSAFRPRQDAPILAAATSLDSTLPPQPLDAILARLPGSCRPLGRGWCAAAASVLEASAPKPGNVHPAAAFPDLDHAELVAAGMAIAPAMERAAEMPLGRTILAAVTASRSVTRSNANLGIVLAIAPLAAVSAHSRESPFAVAEVLARLTPADAADVWQAIMLARPGGLGRSGRHDLAGPPPDDLLAAMRVAAPQDAIARLWAEGYDFLFDGLVADLEAAIGRGLRLDEAIVDAFLAHLAREPDSLIVRRHGLPMAEEVSRRAADARSHPPTIPDFDRFLRSPRRLNPGTTADLTAAALYILLRAGRLPADAAVPWPAAATFAPPPPSPHRIP